MTAPTVSVTVDFVAPVGSTTVEDDAVRASISRGRTDLLDTDISAGTASVVFNNEDRAFDPTHTTSPLYPAVVPGRAVTITAAGVTIYSGFVNDWDLEYDVSLRSVAVLKSADRLGLLAQAEMDEWTSSATSADGKLDALCDLAEVDVDALDRDFDAGLELMSADVVPWGTTPLAYAQKVARTDQGFFFAAADGLLTFRSRLARYVTPEVTFGGTGTYVEALLDDAGDPLLDESDEPLTTEPITVIPYQEIRATIGAELLFARVGVSRDGGVGQTATVADLAAWKAAYGPVRSYSLDDTLLANDGRSLAIANYLLDLYDAPAFRISEVTVELAGLDSDQQVSVLSLDIGSTIAVRFTPNDTGSEIVQNGFIQGIDHEIEPASHRVTFNIIPAFTSDADGWDVGLWDTAEWQ